MVSPAFTSLAYISSPLTDFNNLLKEKLQIEADIPFLTASYGLLGTVALGCSVIASSFNVQRRLVQIGCFAVPIVFGTLSRSIYNNHWENSNDGYVCKMIGITALTGGLVGIPMYFGTPFLLNKILDRGSNPMLRAAAALSSVGGMTVVTAYGGSILELCFRSLLRDFG